VLNLGAFGIERTMRSHSGMGSKLRATSAGAAMFRTARRKDGVVTEQRCTARAILRSARCRLLILAVGPAPEHDRAALAPLLTLPPPLGAGGNVSQ